MFVFNFLFVAKIANSSETSKFNIVNRYQRNDEYFLFIPVSSNTKKNRYLKRLRQISETIATDI